MKPTIIPNEPGCLARMMHRFDATHNKYAVTLWCDGTVYFATWCGAQPPSLQALLTNLAAFPFAWSQCAQTPPQS